MTDLWIVGGGGAALEAWAVARAMIDVGTFEWRLRGFLVSGSAIAFAAEGLDVLDEDAFLGMPAASSSAAVIAIGDPTRRSVVAQRLAAHGSGFATLIHPTAVIGPRCNIGAGTVAMAGAVLETDVTVGSHCLLNVQCSIAHNGTLGNCCNIGPGVHLAGWTTLGDRCDLGVGCSVRPRTTLGADTRVGAGAAVTSNHPGNAILVGVPARPLGDD